MKLKTEENAQKVLLLFSHKKSHDYFNTLLTELFFFPLCSVQIARHPGVVGSVGLPERCPYALFSFFISLPLFTQSRERANFLRG